MSQMAWMSSDPSTRLLVSPSGAVAYMVALGSGVWARPRLWPASCVMVFWMSKRTQPVWLGSLQGEPSTAVKMNRAERSEWGASFNSVSLSWIWPVKRFEVVVVVAMAPSPWSQQS